MAVTVCRRRLAVATAASLTAAVSESPSLPHRRSHKRYLFVYFRKKDCCTAVTAAMDVQCMSCCASRTSHGCATSVYLASARVRASACRCGVS